MTEYSLLDLRYDGAELEPYISVEIILLHLDKHQSTCVKGVNTVGEQFVETREQESFTSLSTPTKSLAFHLGGHVRSLGGRTCPPDCGDKLDGDLAAAIGELFGSFGAFRGRFEADALGV